MKLTHPKEVVNNAQVRRVARRLLPAGSRRRMFAGRMKQVILRRDGYSRWIRDVEPFLIEPQGNTKQDVLFSIIVPTYNTPRKYLKPLIQSLVNQTYHHWELCLADGSTNSKTSSMIKAMSKQDHRIKYYPLSKNLGISGNTNEALKHVTGTFVAFLDHDDTLPTWALLEVRKAIEQNPKVDLIYSDEDKLTERGKRLMPFFKPDWSPELLLGVNYMAHFVVVRKKLVDVVGGLRPEFDGAQDFDFLLRIMDHKPNIVHIPKVLYHWRMAQGSTARGINAKSYADLAGRAALKDYIKRNNIDADVIPIKQRPTNYRVQYRTTGNPKVSIIIPFKDKQSLLKNCVESIVQKTTYDNYEIILVSNNSTEKKTLDYLKSLRKYRHIHQYTYDKPFNYSAVNNYGRKQASGSVLVFLNNDTKVITKEWLDELVGVAIQKSVGAVGPMLLYADKTIQHSGIVLGLTGMAGHVFRGLRPGTFTPHGLPDWPRNYLAVTGACLVIESRKFDEVDGFNEEFTVCGSDVTLCLDLHERGYRNVYWPYARLLHYESKSVGSYKNIPITDYELSLIHYQPYLKEGDIFYSRNLDMMNEMPTPRKSHA